jgi:hypothetical protein
MDPVRTDVSEKLVDSIIRATRIGALGITLAVTRNRSTQRSDAIVVPSSPILVTQMMKAIPSS